MKMVLLFILGVCLAEIVRAIVRSYLNKPGTPPKDWKPSESGDEP